jgi:hypothetical protein
MCAPLLDGVCAPLLDGVSLLAGSWRSEGFAACHGTLHSRVVWHGCRSQVAAAWLYNDLTVQPTVAAAVRGSQAEHRLLQLACGVHAHCKNARELFQLVSALIAQEAKPANRTTCKQPGSGWQPLPRTTWRLTQHASSLDGSPCVHLGGAPGGRHGKPAMPSQHCGGLCGPGGGGMPDCAHVHMEDLRCKPGPSMATATAAAVNPTTRGLGAAHASTQQATRALEVTATCMGWQEMRTCTPKCGHVPPSAGTYHISRLYRKW